MKKKNPLFIQHVTFNYVTRNYTTQRVLRGGSYDEDVKIEDYQICPLEVRDPDFFDSNIRQDVLGFRICRTAKENL